jgi:hypothetical protein
MCGYVSDVKVSRGGYSHCVPQTHHRNVIRLHSLTFYHQYTSLRCARSTTSRSTPGFCRSVVLDPERPKLWNTTLFPGGISDEGVVSTMARDGESSSGSIPHFRETGQGRCEELKYIKGILIPPKIALVPKASHHQSTHFPNSTKQSFQTAQTRCSSPSSPPSSACSWPPRRPSRAPQPRPPRSPRVSPPSAPAGRSSARPSRRSPSVRPATATGSPVIPAALIS